MSDDQSRNEGNEEWAGPRAHKSQPEAYNLKAGSDTHRRTVGACFPASAELITLTGRKNISEITQGEKVLTWDISSDSLMFTEVMWRACHGDRNIFEICLLNGKKIRTTPNHTFLCNRGWLRADELKTGDRLINQDKCFSEVYNCKITEDHEPVFSIITYKTNTFLVDGIVAHNFTEFRTAKSLICNQIWQAYLWIKPKPNNLSYLR